jgi:hypothetical protein
MPNNCHLLDPTYFSLPTTFTGHYNLIYNLIIDTNINNSRNIHGKFNFGSILYKDHFGKKS